MLNNPSRPTGHQTLPLELPKDLQVEYAKSCSNRPFTIRDGF